MRRAFYNLGTALALGGTIAAALILGMLALGPPRGVETPPPRAAATVTREEKSQNSMASITPMVTPTFTAIPTLAEAPNVAPGTDLESTPTPDPVAEAVRSGRLVFGGPLTHAQQASLYRVALDYAQGNVRDSKKKAEEINGAGYSDPSNVCGPLAIAIMRDAGLVAPDVVPHDFWLLDPRAPTDQQKLTRVFPSEQFDHTKVTTPLNEVDWTATPLQPGDFVFIWHGSGGNFDHMLVVSRVDNDMRAYAVTNFGTAEGYLIDETMLYDPHDPSAGMFHTWTKQRDALLGSTGFGGYEIWRLRGQ